MAKTVEIYSENGIPCVRYYLEGRYSERIENIARICNVKVKYTREYTVLEGAIDRMKKLEKKIMETFV